MTETLRAELENELLSTNQIAKAMGLKIVTFESRRVEVEFPIFANSNRSGTVFGGSLFSAGILSAYLLYRAVIAQHEIKRGKFLNQKADIEYLTPGRSDFRAVAKFNHESEDSVKLIGSLRQSGVGCMPIEADLISGDELVAKFSAVFLISP